MGLRPEAGLLISPKVNRRLWRSDAQRNCRSGVRPGFHNNSPALQLSVMEDGAVSPLLKIRRFKETKADIGDTALSTGLRMSI